MEYHIGLKSKYILAVLSVPYKVLLIQFISFLYFKTALKLQFSGWVDISAIQRHYFAAYSFLIKL